MADKILSTRINTGIVLATKKFCKKHDIKISNFIECALSNWLRHEGEVYGQKPSKFLGC